MTTTGDAQDSARDAVLRQLLDELVTAAVDSTTVTPGSAASTKGAVDAVCRPSRPKPSITALKEGIDSSCDREFGVESLEADGPADSWLINADLSSAAADEAAGGRMFCKGPSWDGFVDRMRSQTAEAGSQGAASAAAAGDSAQQGPAAAGLPSGAASNTSDLSHTPTRSNSLSLRRQSSNQQGSRTASRKLASPEAGGSSAGTAVSDPAVADGAAASPLPPSGRLSRSSSAQKAKSSSRRSSLSGPDSSNAETPAKQDQPADGATELGEAASGPAPPPAAAAEEAVTPALQTPVRSSGGGTAQDVENAAWMASLRKGSASGSSSRRVSRSQSTGGASPATPSRSASKLTNTRSARMSAPGPLLASPATPGSASSSRSSGKKPLSVSTSKGRETPGSASRSNSGKYSLRRSRPGTPTSGPTSPLLSPGRTAGSADSSASATPAAAKTSAAASSNSSRKTTGGGMKPNATAVATAAGSALTAAFPRSPTSPQSATSPRAAAPARAGGAGAAGPGYSKKVGTALRPKQTKVGSPNKKKPKQGSNRSDSPKADISPAVAEAKAAAAIAAAEADEAAEAAAAAQQKLAEYTRTLETAEELKRQADAAVAARVTGDSTADVPLHVDGQHDEQWATDTTAIQLFMDEYKDAIEAVDSAVDRAYSAQPPINGAVADPSSTAVGGDGTVAGTTAEDIAAEGSKLETAGPEVEPAAPDAGEITAGDNLPTAEHAAARKSSVPGHQQQQIEGAGLISGAINQAAATAAADAMVAAAKSALIARADEDAAKRAQPTADTPQQQHHIAAALEAQNEQPHNAPACGCRCTIM